MIEIHVSLYVKIKQYRQLVDNVIKLPKAFRPIYFTVGSRVRNKEASKIEQHQLFSNFISEHIEKTSGFDLIGNNISFGFFVGGTRNQKNESTHVGCSVILKGNRWKPDNFIELLKEMCMLEDVESADICCREEWRHRHVCVKKLSNMSIQESLGTDISATLPGIYWWTIYSEDLINKHALDINELKKFSAHYEYWLTENNKKLHAFRFFDSPKDWDLEKERIDDFIEKHFNFFSLRRLTPLIEEAQSKEDFDKIVRPYWAGAIPWQG